MRYALNAACTGIWLLTMVTASPAQNSLGMAAVPCRDFLRAARSSDILYHQASQWLLGYASGMNGALKAMKGSEAAIGLSNEQALKSALSYCEANPASTLETAAHEWYAALPKTEQAEAKSPPKSGSLILNLDTAPSRKPLLDRR